MPKPEPVMVMIESVPAEAVEGEIEDMVGPGAPTEEESDLDNSLGGWRSTGIPRRVLFISSLNCATLLADEETLNSFDGGDSQRLRDR